MIQLGGALHCDIYPAPTLGHECMAINLGSVMRNAGIPFELEYPHIAVGYFQVLLSAVFY